MEEDRMQDHTHDLGPLFGTYLLRLPEVILKYMDPVSHPCLPFLYPVFPVSHVSNMGKISGQLWWFFSLIVPGDWGIEQPDNIGFFLYLQVSGLCVCFPNRAPLTKIIYNL